MPRSSKNNVQYVYGAKMQVMSLSEIKALQKVYGTGYVWNSDLNKAGKLCCDCSGLISSYTGVIRNSSNYKQVAPEIATISQVKKNWSKYVGWAFWLQGHIGVVSDTEGYYYAMDGSARNMVHFPISKQNWTYAIKIKDIDYSAVPPTLNVLTLTGLTTANLNVRKYANTECEIIATLPKNSSVNIVNKYTDGWYEVIHNESTRYVSSSYVTVPTSIYNIKTAINKLVDKGCISTKEYWLNHYADLQYLDLLIVNMALAVKKKDHTKSIKTYNDALNVLVNKGVINSPAYWLSNVNKVQYLKELIINVGNALK